MRARLLWMGAAFAALAVVYVVPGLAGGTKGTSTVLYDNFSSAAASSGKWVEPYGPGEAAPSLVDKNHFLKITNGIEEMKALPFRTGYDYSVYDHLKLMEVSAQQFPAPANGSVAFSADITAATPGTVRNLVQTGIFGGPWTWTDPQHPPTAPDYSASVLEGQQAGVVLNMIDFCTGQLFDWFVSGSQAFTLIERLPTSVTGNTTNAGCPDAEFVGPSLMYTQIANVVPISAGKHQVSMRYTQTTTGNSIEYVLDNKLVTTVNHVGIPLDKQAGAAFTGTYPSLGPGEELSGKINSFSIGHGLFSLLDAFPFQYPTLPDLSVSIPVGSGDPADAGRARLFGQGADGTFDNITVTTVTN